MTACILFDLDGTLVDSERITGRAFQILLPGLELSIEGFVHRYAGEKLADVVAELTALAGVEAEEDFIPRLRQVAAGLFRRELRAFEGVQEALARLTVPFCIASATRAWKALEPAL